MRALARTTPQPVEPSGLLDWWLAELQELLPGRGSSRGRRRRAALQLRLEPPFVRVLSRRGPRLEPVGSFLLPEEDGRDQAPGAAWCEPELQRLLTRHKDATVLVMGPTESLTCVDLLPASAENELGRIVAHKIDLLTPWPADQVYAAHRVAARRPDGMLEVLLAVAPRRAVDAALRRLAALGITPAAVDVASDGKAQRAEVDLLHAETPGPHGRSTRLLLALLLVAALGTVGFAGTRIWQRHQQLVEQRQLVAALEERLADLPTLRERITSLQTEAGFLANDRRSRPSPLIVLEVLSRLLPDTVWLSEIRLDERELVIAGLAEDSSTLVPLIERAPEFAQVRFQTPSTRVKVRTAAGGEREVERFAISAAVDPAVEPSL